MNRTSLFSLAATIVILSGCATKTRYIEPNSAAPRARLSIDVQTVKLISGFATVDVVAGPSKCGQEYPDSKRAIVISRGNPLISNINAEGIWVNADQPIHLVTMMGMDGFSCGQALSFTPEAGGNYQLRAVGQSSFNRYAAPTCKVQVVSRSNPNGSDVEASKPLGCIR
ncbi:hypothetical protein [Cupriavidus sp. PET2-C1]